jgi:hypothetical protein
MLGGAVGLAGARYAARGLAVPRSMKRRAHEFDAMLPGDMRQGLLLLR